MSTSRTAALAIFAALLIGSARDPFVAALAPASAGSRGDRMSVGGAPAPAAPSSVDWPQWRGPGRDGHAPDATVAARWPDGGPPERWRRELRGGFSGLAISGGRLYTMDAGDADRLLALAVDDGSQAWEARVDDRYRDGQGDGPRATPTVADGRVFALSGNGTLAAFDASDGRRLWSHDLRAEFGAAAPSWGFSGSPLVDGSRLLVEVGGRSGAGIMAFDVASGRELWRSQNDPPAYASPILVTIDGRRTAVFFTRERLVGIAPEDGRALWSSPWTTSYGVNAATPIFVPPDRIFVSSGYDVGSALFEVGADGLETVWRNREMKNQFSSSVRVEGYAYGFDNSVLECIDLASGERMWRARGFGHGSLLYADGHLVVLGDGGDLALVVATPGEFREVARARPLSGLTWTMPSLANGILYVRSQRELVALDLRPPDSPARRP